MEESSDEDDFRPVVGKRRRKKASDDESVVGSGREEENLLNKNKFSQLAGSSSNKNNNNNNGNPAGGDGAPPVPAAKRQPKQPPLVVKNTGFQDLVQVISSCSTKPFYKLTSAGIKLQCRTAGGFDNLRSHLQENNVEFYTHSKRNERPQRVVIRGLPQYKPETVKQLLKKFQKLHSKKN